MMLVMVMMVILVWDGSQSRCRGEPVAWQRTTARSQCYFYECDPLFASEELQDTRRTAALLDGKLREQAAAQGSLWSRLQLRALLAQEETNYKWQCLRESSRVQANEALAHLSNLFSMFPQQEKALQTVYNAVRNHLISGGPTAIHLMGNNGVGKTAISRAVGLALGRELHPQMGSDYSSNIVYVNCIQLANSNSIDRVVEKILLAVRRNARSVVIIDDLQFLFEHPHIINTLGGLVAATNAYDTDVSKAIFIFTSNFGSEFLKKDLSMEELTRQVYELHIKTFQQPLVELSALVPVLSYEFEGFVDIADALLRHMLCRFTIAKFIGPDSPFIEYHPQLPDFLARAVYADGRLDRQARLVENYFNDLIVGPLHSAFFSSFPLTRHQVIRIGLRQNTIYFELIHI